MEHDRILGYFLEEASEHLNTIEQGLLKLPETVRQPTTIRELFRAAHSIKGSAAMLGLLDIQKIGNQFEANFKLLKEQPQIAVDSHLQSLFLESFGFLKAGIEEVRHSSDPYRQDPATIDPIGDPVFEELKAYLQHLLAAEPAAVVPDRTASDGSKDPAIDQVFGEYVTRKLDTIISLCLQPDLPEVRAQIQQICQKLGNLGENFEFLEWTHLFTACRLATANPANFLPQLGESISIAVKQAQALVLADRDREIRVTADLEALIISKTVPLQTADLESTATLSPDRSNLTTQNLDRDTTTDQLPALISIGGTTLPLVPAAQLLDFDTTNNLFANPSSTFLSEFDPEAMELNEFMNLLGDELPSDGTWMQDDEFRDLALPSIDLDNLANHEAFPPQLSELATADLDRSITASHNLPLVPALDDEAAFYNPELGDLDGQIPDFSSATALSIAQHQPIYSDLNPLEHLDGQLQPEFSPSLPLAESPVPDFSLDYPLDDLFPATATTEDWANLADLSANPLAEAETLDDANRFDFEDESFQMATTGTFAAIDRGDAQPMHPIELPTPAADLQPQSAAAELTDGSTATSDILSLEDLNNSPSAAIGAGLGLAGSPSHKFPDAADLSGLANLNGTPPAADADLLFLEDLDNLDANLDADLLFLQDLDEQTLTANVDLLGDSSDRQPDPEPTAAEDAIAMELSNWVDNASNPGDDRAFGELDLAILDDIAATNSATGDDALNFEPHTLVEDEVAAVDLGESNDITGFELDIQNFDDLEQHGEIGNSLADLDLDFLADDASDNGTNSIEWPDLAELDLQTPDDLDLDLPAPTASLLDVNAETSDRQRVNAIDPIEPATERDFDSIDMGALAFDNLASDASPTAQFNNLDDLDADLGSNDLSLDNFDNLSAELDSNDLSLDNLDNLSAELDSNELSLDNLDNLSAELDSNDLSLDNLDNLSAELNSNDLSLDNFDDLLGEMPAADLPDLGNLDALLGVAAVGGIGGSLLVGALQSSALDDLDALVAPAPVADSNLDDLDGLFATPKPVVVAPVQPPARESKERRPKQSRTFEQTMRVSVRHLNNLNNLVGELVVNRNTLEQDQNRMRQFVEKLLSEVQKLNEVGKRMQDLYERSLMENSLVASRQQYKASTAAPQTSATDEISGASGSNSGIEYDPLEMDRFTPIHLLSQKMIELTVRVRESTADIEFVVDGSTEVTRTLRQITGQLQEDLTKSRMVPFAQTADRLQRGVRDNGLKYGKQVELSVEGRDTLIDKVILESLTDPLIHMVNNAIAHGIESNETRQAAGKPSEGKIIIRALHQGNQTIISVSDDGAGIDTDRVKQKAIEKGILTVQQAAAMSKTEAYELLFLPSFSTKDEADELAGRGVGMDVVRTSITEIRGTIATESKLGVGTTFTIRLPLALSIAKALIAVNNKSNIAFPMDGIEDTQDVSPEQIQTDSDGKQCIFWRDELLPFTPLSDLLSFNRPLARNSFYSTNEDDSDLVSILILRSDGNLTAVQVDKITGDQEIVIKPLQGPAAKPLGIAGATVMGDGRIVPIADVMELIELANGTLSRQVSTQWTDQIAAPTVEIRESMVLIVDDSITVRELLSLTFKRAGYRVEQARDGQEAWDKLRAGLPCDIVFCDIEMPRMDGLEFLSRIQKDAALSKVPVAMLTSRGSDRHRQIASQLGASGYFIKPYLEEALLDAAKRMIKGEVLEIV
ncbi:response regulator [Chamaesiphon sp. VAR_69_metabat_338]|uniref:response regulator n=1 Tax=Chamaesiphon sp. VAR_69_metabat_338 TaxID=2964704 RepID=UPI00286E4AD7|nr:response regulator [Chamaesiphon sp. VAR_69_metabat_338]